MVGMVSYGSVRLFAHPTAGSLVAAATPAGLRGGLLNGLHSGEAPLTALTVSTGALAPTTLRGQLVCVHCLLSERYHLKSDCQHEGHRGALLLSDGTLIYFMDGTDDKLRKPEGTGTLLEHELEVEGDYAPGEKFLKVRNYHLVNS